MPHHQLIGLVCDIWNTIHSLGESDVQLVHALSGALPSFSVAIQRADGLWHEASRLVLRESVCPTASQLPLTTNSIKGAEN
ncbi:hypothetical protein FKM82_026279 [Ascaphus truei]